jgi:hypothetical protein
MPAAAIEGPASIIARVQHAASAAAAMGWLFDRGRRCREQPYPLPAELMTRPLKNDGARDLAFGCGRPQFGSDREGAAAEMRAFYRWATTPPQAYLVYAILIVVIGGLSFFAGTLKPKKTTGVVPTTASRPAN